MPLPAGVRRLFWKSTLLFALGSAIYAVVLLTMVAAAAPFEWLEPLALPVLLGHFILYPFISDTWSRRPNSRWGGLVAASSATHRRSRTAIRLFGRALVVGTASLAVLVFHFGLRSNDDRIPAGALGLYILFGSFLSGTYSLLGADAVTTGRPGPYDRLLIWIERKFRLERARRRRRRRRREV